MTRPPGQTMLGLGKTRTGKGGLGPIARPLPEPGNGQALIEVSAAGICGTDLHIEDDEFPSSPPVIMGHEVAGRVAGVGPGTPEELVGELVAVETYFEVCGECGQCRSGRTNLCKERLSIGSHVDGGFAPWLVVPAVNLHRLPDHVGPHAGVLCEPLACVCHSMADPSVVSPGDDVLITGPGTMGLLAAQVARSSGGKAMVVGTERDAVRLEAARALGFETAVGGLPALDRSHDVVVECSGTEAGIATCLNAVRPGGAYVQIGLAGVPVRVAIDEICYREVTLTSGFASTPQSWRRALKLLEQRQVEFAGILSAVLSLSSWREVFDRTRRGDGVKYALEPRWEDSDGV